MSKLEALSRKYADHATKLTEGLERAEQRLLDLPGRARTVTNMGEGESLVWDRHDGEWRILLAFGDSEVPVATVRVEQKAKAAKFLSCFFGDIEAAIQKKLDTVDTGLGALKLFFNPAVPQ